MADVLRIKRRAVGGAAGAPATLAAAELAYNEQTNILYYGGGNSAGAATSIFPIAGPGAFLPLSGGILTGNVTVGAGANLNFGSVLASSTTDLSNHLALYGTNYGLNITSGRLNLVGGSIVCVSSGVDVATINASGVTANAPLQAIGNETGSLASTQFVARHANGFMSANPGDADATWTSLQMGERINNVSGAFTADRTITIPLTGQQRNWVVRNGTTGGFNVNFTTGTSTYSIPPAYSAELWTNGVSLFPTHNLLLGVPVRIGDGTRNAFLFNAGATPTTASTINTSGAGVLQFACGVGFGSVLGASGSDVTAHLALWGTTFGLGVTSNRLNHIAGATAQHAFVLGTTDAAFISSTGLNATAVGATTPSTGSFTTLAATGNVSSSGGWINAGTATTSGSKIYVNSAVTTAPGFSWYSAGSQRWFLALDAFAESGSNAGSNLALYNYSDTGAFLGAVCTFRRTDGQLTLNAGLSVAGAISGAGVTTLLASYAPLASPALTGVPSAPTAAALTNTTQLATTAFVTTATAAYLPLVGGNVTGATTFSGGGVTVSAGSATVGAINITANTIFGLRLDGGVFSNCAIRLGTNQMLGFTGAGTRNLYWDNVNDTPTGLKWSIGSVAAPNPVITLADAGYVQASSYYADGASGAWRIMRVLTGGVLRWIAGGNLTAESTGDVGTDYDINAYNDSGALIGTCLRITRSTGLFMVYRGLGIFTQVAPGGITDLSRHIALYATTYGFNVTANRLNYLAPLNASHFFNVNAIDVAQISATGINAAAIGATTPSTGSFTTLAATGTVSGAGFTGLLAPYAPLASPALTGVPITPNAAVGDESTQIASTLFAARAAQGLNQPTPGDADTTLTAAQLDGRAINVIGTLTADRTYTVPMTLNRRNWLIRNGTTGGFNITITCSGGTSFTIPPGYITEIWTNSFNIFTAQNMLCGTIARIGDPTRNGFIFSTGATPTSASNISTQGAGAIQFIGAVTATTPATADNTTTLATTAFVKNQAYATLASPALTGVPTAPTAAALTNTTQIATTAFVTAANNAAVLSFNSRVGAITLTNADVTGVLLPSSTTPNMDGTAAIGVGTTWARADHTHPTDTSLLSLGGGTVAGATTFSAGGVTMSGNNAGGWGLILTNTAAYGIILNGTYTSAALRVSGNIAFTGAANRNLYFDNTVSLPAGLKYSIGTTAAPNVVITLGDTGLVTCLQGMSADNVAGTNRGYQFKTGGLARWWFLCNPTAEGGSNAGSDLDIVSYDDTGAILVNPVFRITRSTGLVLFNRGISLASTVGATTSDLSRGIALFGTNYGFNVTASRLNYVAPLNASHYFVVNALDVGFFSATGLNAAAVGASTPSTGSFTTLAASGAVSGAGFTTLLAPYAPLASPALTGVPTAPTATAGTNTTQIATTAFVTASLGSPTFSGTVTAPQINLKPTSGSATVLLFKLAGQSAGATCYNAANSLPRWELRIGNTDAESTGNAGTNFDLRSYTDAGGFLSTPLFINRATGAMTVTGNFLATGTVSGNGAYINTSDMRIKYDVGDFGDGLSAIARLRPVRFKRHHWHSDNIKAPRRFELGFIAQEVRDVIPEAVFETDIDMPDGSWKEDSPVLGMSLDPIVAALVNGMKELAAQNAALAARVQQLEARTLH
jgi:hypothetical protein